MKHHATEAFWKCYDAPPPPTCQQADKSFALLKANPDHPSLQFKSVGRFWSARIGLAWRALAVKDPASETLIWFWIGSHSEYDRLVERKR